MDKEAGAKVAPKAQEKAERKKAKVPNLSGSATTSNRPAARTTMVADGMLLRLRGKAMAEAMAMVVVEAGPSNAVDYLQEKMSMRDLCQSALISYQTFGRSRGPSAHQGR